MVDIYGRPIAPPQAPPKPSGIPVWIAPVAVVLGGIALIVVLKKSRRASAPVAGYRRKARRSRR